MKLNYKVGVGIKTIYKVAGPHRHTWLAAGPLGGFCSWAEQEVVQKIKAVTCHWAFVENDLRHIDKC
jgi:hypothetical protein